jgi:N-methylhydantoinase B
MSDSSVNPITVEVVRNGLAHISNEMATVLRKTSYNMMIYEVRDYCVGIVDPEGNILSQNFGALPIFLADLDHESSLCMRPTS